MKDLWNKLGTAISFIAFIAAAIGWYISESNKNAVDAAALQTLIEKVSDLDKSSKEQWGLQREINGKILMYIELDSNE